MLSYAELIKLPAKLREGEDVQEDKIIKYMRWIDTKIFRDVPKEKMTNDLCLAAVDMDEKNLLMIPEEKRTLRMYHTAVDRNLDFISVVPKEFMTHALAYKVCAEKPFWIFCCKTIPITKMMTDLLPDNLFEYTNLNRWNREIPERLSKICRLYLERDGRVLQFVQDPSLEECVVAFYQNPASLRYIPHTHQRAMFDLFKENQNLWTYVAKDVQTDLARYVVNLTGAPQSLHDVVQKYILPMIF